MPQDVIHLLSKLFRVASSILEERHGQKVRKKTIAVVHYFFIKNIFMAIFFPVNNSFCQQFDTIIVRTKFKIKSLRLKEENESSTKKVPTVI